MRTGPAGRTSDSRAPRSCNLAAKAPDVTHSREQPIDRDVFIERVSQWMPRGLSSQASRCCGVAASRCGNQARGTPRVRRSLCHSGQNRMALRYADA